MKRIISTVLASMILLSVAGCGTTAPDTATAATASTAEQTLIDRLGKVPENIILGDASVAAEYGIDMTDFESDGYILRTVGDSTLVFGKASDGLDRAVRAYAKAVDAGREDTLNETWHEGTRIDSLTIAGRDISEYTVYYPADTNANMKFAVDDFVRLVAKATGVTLPVVQGTPVAPAIEFRHSTDPVFEDEGYRYEVTANGLVIEGAVDRGCMNAIYRFLQKECGWENLIYGDSYLNEADHIDIPVGTKRQETPAFEYFQQQAPYIVGFSTERGAIKTVEQLSYGSAAGYGEIPCACHGMQNNRFCDYDIDYWKEQICYSDEDRYWECSTRVDAYIQAQLAAGKVLGRDLKCVDIAAGDNSNYCFCEICAEVFEEEGNAHSGAVVRFANRMADEFNETYPGLNFLIFAYNGTNKPCKTAPNDHVFLTYCFDYNCSNHLMDGSQCDGNIPSQNGIRNNSDFNSDLAGWCALTKNVWVWYYSLPHSVQNYTIVDNIYDDIRYLRDLGVRGVFHEGENNYLGIKHIENQLTDEMFWNPDMSREEYEEIFCELLAKYYGEGWQYIRDFVYHWEESQDRMSCWHCWNWSVIGLDDKRYDTHYYMNHYDEFVTLFDEALLLAESQWHQDNIERLSITMLYMGCYSSYYIAHIKGDTERMEVLSDRYDRSLELLRKFGYDPNKIPTLHAGDSADLAATIEEAAQIDWIKWYEAITGYKTPADINFLK